MLPTLLSRRASPSATPCRSKISRACASRGERLLVLAEGNQALKRAVQRPRHVHFPSRAPEQLRRRVVVFQGLVVLAADEPDVTDGSQALRPAAVVVEFFGHPCRRLRQAVRPLHVDPRQPHDTGVQAFDDGRLPELRCAGEESSCAPATVLNSAS